MTAPHFLRFTRALALGASVVAAGCGSNVQPDASGDSSTSDVATADSTTPDSNTSDVNECSLCQCAGIAPLDVASGSDGGLPMCTSAQIHCCAAVGPLPPPELSA